jgi:hypothetical protein
MSVLNPFSHDVLKETVQSLPQHRVTIVSRSTSDICGTLRYIRSEERRGARHMVEKVFKNDWTEAVRQRQSEWPTEATVQHHTPAFEEVSPRLTPTILDSEVQIDQHLLDSMARELANEEASTDSAVSTNVDDLSAVRAAVDGSAITTKEAKERMIATSIPQGEQNDLPKAA